MTGWLLHSSFMVSLESSRDALFALARLQSHVNGKSPALQHLSILYSLTKSFGLLRNSRSCQLSKLSFTLLGSFCDEDKQANLILDIAQQHDKSARQVRLATLCFK